MRVHRMGRQSNQVQGNMPHILASLQGHIPSQYAECSPFQDGTMDLLWKGILARVPKEYLSNYSGMVIVIVKCSAPRKFLNVSIGIMHLHDLLNMPGPPETKLAMATYFGELVLSNDVKVVVASLVNVMRSGNMQ
ncbi:hypothetical protein IFM89_037799 [Coptis chinensis]|uniref:Uncharacterized protein n=1 Tax=Coptis chinensis TaxID=261450 RepID=A0A835LYB4_9MAGN|nr:hypothetical protein IFM89_037799 [Coptis chinensis]